MTVSDWIAVGVLLAAFSVGVVLVLRFAPIKKRYRTLLLDVDGTLLDFDRCEEAALRDTFRAFSLPYGEETHAVYHRCNDACWKALERGEITRDELKIRRYRDTLAELNLDADPAQMTRRYEEALGSYTFPYPETEEICRKLAKKYDLYLATNGLKNVQSARLIRTEFATFVRGVYISEEVGAAKPSPEFFDRIFADHPEIKRSETLMVGDSLTGDIRGGINAGIDVCWINRTGAARPDRMKIDFELPDLTRLPEIL